MRPLCVTTLASLLLAGATVRGDEVDPAVQKVIDKGLDYLAKTQFKDGHFEGTSGQYPTALTALAGMAFLMEGSTLREGKYSENLRRMVDWMTERTQRSGLIGNPNNYLESQRYMYGHGFGMLFLACVYGEEEDGDRRKKLEELLTRAAVFSGRAQTTRGGWGYISAADGSDFDEGSVTITQLQGLRAARDAGIPVQKEIIDKARKYLQDCTTARGGVLYSPGRTDERPALTAAAVICGFSAGEYESAIVKKWLAFCQQNMGKLNAGGGGVRMGHDEYAHYYFSQACYTLNEEGYAKLFPNSKPEDRLTWKNYRKDNFDFMLKNQNADGSWTGNSPWARFGAVYTTAMYLAILQLDKNVLPIYQR